MFNPAALHPSNLELRDELRQFFSAENFSKAVSHKIDQMREGLTERQELEVYFYNSVGHRFRVIGITYENPSLIVLKGITSLGEEVQILAHSQAIQLYISIRPADQTVDELNTDNRLSIKP
jgi:hypothetical protein